jgi:integrase
MGAIMGRKPTVNDNLPPMMRRRRRGESVYYYFDTGEQNPRREIPLGTDYVTAVKKWSQLSRKPAPVVATIGWLIAKYRQSDEFAAVGAGTQADYSFALDMLGKHFGDAPVDQVRPEHVRMYVALRSTGSETVKPSRHRALREKAVLSMIYNWSGGFGYANHNPAGEFKPLRYKRLPGRRDIEIPDATLDAAYAKGSVALQEAMDLAYYLGQRPADVLKVLETDIEGGHFKVVQGKTGHVLYIPIIDGLAALVERVAARKRACKVQTLSQVFLVDERGMPMTKAKLRARFEDAREAAGIAGADFQFRDLRRKSGTDLRRQAGAAAAQELLGHDTKQMTDHYTGLAGNIISAIPRRTASDGGRKS